MAIHATRPRTQYEMRGNLWTAAELRAFLDIASGHRLGAFYRLAAYTGARRGELLNLCWPDLRLDGAELTISGSSCTIEGQSVRGATKTGRPRTLTLDHGNVEVMRQHMEAQDAERSARRSWRDKPDLVFRREDGKPLHMDTPGQLMTQLVAKADPPPATLHDLRHYYASGLIAAGCDVVTVQRALGHAKATTTLNTYAHLWPTAEDGTRTGAQSMLSAALAIPADSVRTNEYSQVSDAKIPFTTLLVAGSG